MLTNNQKEKIYWGVKDKLPELKKMLECKQKLFDFIKSSAFSILTEDEKRLIKRFPNLVVPQPVVAISGREIGNIETEDIKKELEGLYPYYSYSRYYFPDWTYNECITISNKDEKDGFVPLLFTDWEDFKKNHPKLYVEARDMVIEGLRYRKITTDKLKKLDDLMSANYMTLTLLKKNFVELYELAKK